MSDLAGLIDRLEKLTGPDREVDADTALSVGYTRRNGEWWFGHCYMGKVSPALTASLDATVALVERCLPGWDYSAGRSGKAYGGFLYPPDFSPSDNPNGIEAYSPATPSIALLLALLRATQKEERT